MRRRTGSRLAAIAFAIVALATCVPAAAADDAWTERVTAEVARVEAGLAALDAKAASGGTLVDRVAALHVRLAALEVLAGVPVGAPPSGRGDLATLTQDVARVTTRWRAIVDVGSPRTVPTAPPAPPTVAPPRSTGTPWPRSIAFGVKAKLQHEPIGDWVSEYSSLYYPATSYYLLAGHRGVVSFTLGAKNLVREVRAARVLVVVHLPAPFATPLERERRYEVDWVAERALGDGAWKRWNGYDTIEVATHQRLARKPRDGSDDLRAEAHVLWVVTKDGERVDFETPYTVAAPPPLGGPLPAEDAVDALAANPEAFAGRALVFERVVLHGDAERLFPGLWGLGVTTSTGAYVSSSLKTRGVTFVGTETLLGRLRAAGIREGVRYPVRLSARVARRGLHWTAGISKVEFLGPDGRVVASVTE